MWGEDENLSAGHSFSCMLMKHPCTNMSVKILLSFLHKEQIKDLVKSFIQSQTSRQKVKSV